ARLAYREDGASEVRFLDLAVGNHRRCDRHVPGDRGETRRLGGGSARRRGRAIYPGTHEAIREDYREEIPGHGMNDLPAFPKPSSSKGMSSSRRSNAVSF